MKEEEKTNLVERLINTSIEFASHFLADAVDPS
jgi:hypothetical protein